MTFLENIFSNIAFTNIYILLISVCLAAILVFLIFSFLGSKKQKISKNPIPVQHQPLIITSQDIRAIAGDNIMSTQLDLARAYMEMGKTQLAKKILDHVLEHGDLIQKQDAKELIAILEVP